MRHLSCLATWNFRATVLRAWFLWGANLSALLTIEAAMFSFQERMPTRVACAASFLRLGKMSIPLRTEAHNHERA
jgi:hypothetical protein